ncbi:MAG: hypothetical protein U9M92_03175 [Patescibacteria group bacterium]|nr:hypothetical protein [Patescibacteria group bacterium]
MTRSYKRDYHEEQKRGLQKDKAITVLEEQFTNLSDENLKQKTAADKKTAGLKDENTKLVSEVDVLEKRISKTEEQLRVMELSRFASAYAEQEKDYKGQQSFWFKIGIGTTILLSASILVSFFGPTIYDFDVIWYKEPGLYLLNIVFLTVFVYALKQHSHLGNLRIDYANRKTLAQSYQHIIESKEHPEIQKDFLKNASDIFSSKAIMKSSDVTIYEALVAKILGGGRNN